jgi:hypothetical protein
METLGLPLAAARGFRSVEQLREKGWSAEAGQRAGRLEAAWRQRVAAYRRADAEAERIKSGVMPSPDTIASHPDRARLAFIAAVREKHEPLIPALRAIAGALDRASGTTSLAGLVDRQDMLRQMLAHLRAGTLADAEAYQRLAEPTGEPWFAIRAQQLIGKALAASGDPKGAADAYGRALAACEKQRFPYVCTDTKLWLAYLLAGQRRIQEAQRAAREAKDAGVRDVIPEFEADANALLAAIEDLRERFSLARAYAEEAAAQGENCKAGSTGREQLAKLALADGDEAEARRQLTAVVQCSGAASRFQMIGAEALASAAREPAGWDEGFGWLNQTIAGLRAGRALPRAQEEALRLFHARAMLARDRKSARADLDSIVGIEAVDDDLLAVIRLQASSALVVDAARHGELAQALGGLEKMQGIEQGRPCVLGAAQDAGRWSFVVRGRTGQLAGTYLPTWMPETRRSAPPVPPVVLRALEGCAEVGVVATAPVLGQSRLLPDDRAWGYLRSRGQPRPFDGQVRRLVIWDVQPPATLGLQRLLAVPDTAPAPGRSEAVEFLSGPLATPAATLARLPDADLIEWHVHGVVDPAVSDAAALALSPDEGGRALLGARDILALKLPRSPGVVLGACRAGLSARYGAYQWSLPLAFLRAGARWVIASPKPIEDAEAPAFFAGTWRRIALGTSPAIALRDERTSSRWRRSFREWTRDVVLFY